MAIRNAVDYIQRYSFWEVKFKLSESTLSESWAKTLWKDSLQFRLRCTQLTQSIHARHREKQVTSCPSLNVV